MSDTYPIAPHGGTLVDLLVGGDAAAALAERGREPAQDRRRTSASSPTSRCSRSARSARSPGSRARRDYHSVLDSMHLENGLAWAIPVVLVGDRGAGASVRRSAARWRSRRPRAPTPSRCSGSAGRSSATSRRKPSRSTAPTRPSTRASPPCTSRASTAWPATSRCCRCRCTPTSAPTGSRRPRPAPSSPSAAGRRSSASRRATRSTARTSTSQKCALEIVDGLLVHPLVGETKSDDIPADVRMDCYEALLESYYPKDRVMLVDLPGGDALRRARARRSSTRSAARTTAARTSSSGRDHAGVGDYYGTYDAQQIFDEFEPGRARHHAAVLRALVLVQARARAWPSPKTCPHGDGDRVFLSGTKVREMLRGGRASPAGVHAARGRRHPDRGDAGAGGLREGTPAGTAGSPISRLGRRLSLPPTGSPSWSPASMI